MITASTRDIQVTVQTEYQPKYSSPSDDHFVFSYRIRIQNNSEYTVQLISRFWDIYDADGTHRQVEGEGVVGEQPFIAPNQAFEYVSGCNLNSGIGKMKGYYIMERVLDNRPFKVIVPEFSMIFPPRLN